MQLFKKFASDEIIKYQQSGTGAVDRLFSDRAKDMISVKDFGAVGDGSTDDTTAIQNAINAANAAGGGIVFFPAGTYKATSTISMAIKVILQGSGKDTSKISWNNTGDGLQMLSPINSSTGVWTSVRDMYLANSNGSNTGAGYDDVGGTFVTLTNVKIEGFKYGIIFDQTELAEVQSCEFHNNLFAGAWLVNGAEHTMGAQKEFTNRIRIEYCQINEGSSAYGIIDDGGTAHTFKDNNYNGCLTHIFSADSHGQMIMGGEFEGAAGPCIRLDFQTQSGGSAGQGLSCLIQGADIQPVSGQSAINIVSHNKLSLIANVMGGNGTPAAVVGLSNLNSLYALGNDNITFSGTPGRQLTSDDSTVSKFLGTVNFASMSASQALVTDSSKNLSSLAYAIGATGSALAQRDSQGNTIFNNSISKSSNIVSSGQVINMTSASERLQKVTGSSTVTFNLPDCTSLTAEGWTFEFNNNSTGSVTLNKHDGSTLIATVVYGAYAFLVCTDNTTSNGVWDVHWIAPTTVVWGNNTFTLSPGATFNLPGSSTGMVSLTTQANSGTYNWNYPTTAGSAGQVLTSQGGSSSPMTWQTLVNYTSQTTTYSAAIGDYVVCSSSSFTVTLPDASSVAGQKITVQHNGSSSLDKVYTINTTSSQTISGPNGALGSGVIKLYTIGEVFEFTSTGAGWLITYHVATSPAATYTPTLTDNTNISNNVSVWHREGQFAVIYGQIAYNGVGSGSNITIALPANMPNIDTTYIPGTTNTANATASLLGNSQWFDAGVAWKVSFPKYVSTTTIGFWDVNQATTGSEMKNGSSLNFIIKVPIVGWQP